MKSIDIIKFYTFNIISNFADFTLFMLVNYHLLAEQQVNILVRCI